MPYLEQSFPPDSDAEERNKATVAFREAWDYALNWSVDITGGEFGNIKTKMGYAAYAAGSKDFSRDRSFYFADVDAVLRFDPIEMLPS